MDKKAVIAGILALWALLFVALKTDVYLGDETYHFRLAKLIYKTGSRPVSDPIYKDLPKLGYFYSDAPLWHTALAYVWKTTNGVSRSAAQVYQLFYLALLLLATYFLAKELYGEKEAYYSTLVLMSVPAIAVFSILLYIDMPLAALSTLCFLLLLKNKYLLSGLVLGLMVLTKINTLFLLPAVIFFIFYNRKDTVALKSRIKNLFLVGLPALLVNIPDMYFQLKNFGYLYYVSPKFIPKGTSYYYSPGSVVNDPITVLEYTGLLLLAGLVLCIIFFRYQRKDSILWFPIISYAVFWLVFLRYTLDVRYLMPVIPLVSIMAGRAFTNLKNRWINGILIAVCLFQFIFVLGYISVKRRIPAGIKEGYDFVNKNLPSGSVLMYPGEDMVTYTNRPIAWGRILSISDLFWGLGESGMRNVLQDYSIKYIIVKKVRIYDDSKVRHIGSYPASFVKRLPQVSFLRNIFDNRDLSIWKVVNN